MGLEEAVLVRVMDDSCSNLQSIFMTTTLITGLRLFSTTQDFLGLSRLEDHTRS